MTQNIAPDGYMPRIVDAQIERYLKIFCAVEIAGAKWCGKTWSARRRGASIAYLGQSATYATIAQDIYGAEENPQALLTDARLANYLQLLKRLYLLEEVPGWAPPLIPQNRPFAALFPYVVNTTYNDARSS